MVISKLFKILTGDQKLDRWQDGVIATVNQLVSIPMLDQNTLTGVSVVSGTNVIPHGLNRKLIGYLIVGNNAAVTFYDSQSSNSTPAQTLQLIASGTAIINIIVF